MNLEQQCTDCETQTKENGFLKEPTKQQKESSKTSKGSPTRAIAAKTTKGDKDSMSVEVQPFQRSHSSALTLGISPLSSPLTTPNGSKTNSVIEATEDSNSIASEAHLRLPPKRFHRTRNTDGSDAASLRSSRSLGRLWRRNKNKAVDPLGDEKEKEDLNTANLQTNNEDELSILASEQRENDSTVHLHADSKSEAGNDSRESSLHERKGETSFAPETTNEAYSLATYSMGETRSVDSFHSDESMSLSSKELDDKLMHEAVRDSIKDVNTVCMYFKDIACGWLAATQEIAEDQLAEQCIVLHGHCEGYQNQCADAAHDTVIKARKHAEEKKAKEKPQKKGRASKTSSRSFQKKQDGKTNNDPANPSQRGRENKGMASTASKVRFNERPPVFKKCYDDSNLELKTAGDGSVDKFAYNATLIRSCKDEIEMQLARVSRTEYDTSSEGSEVPEDEESFKQESSTFDDDTTLTWSTKNGLDISSTTALRTKFDEFSMKVARKNPAVSPVVGASSMDSVCGVTVISTIAATEPKQSDDTGTQKTVGMDPATEDDERETKATDGEIVVSAYSIFSPTNERESDAGVLRRVSNDGAAAADRRNVEDSPTDGEVVTSAEAPANDVATVVVKNGLAAKPTNINSNATDISVDDEETAIAATATDKEVQVSPFPMEREIKAQATPENSVSCDTLSTMQESAMIRNSSGEVNVTKLPVEESNPVSSACTTETTKGSVVEPPFVVDGANAIEATFERKNSEIVVSPEHATAQELEGSDSTPTPTPTTTASNNVRLAPTEETPTEEPMPFAHFVGGFDLEKVRESVVVDNDDEESMAADSVLTESLEDELISAPSVFSQRNTLIGACLLQSTLQSPLPVDGKGTGQSTETDALSNLEGPSTEARTSKMRPPRLWHRGRNKKNTDNKGGILTRLRRNKT